MNRTEKKNKKRKRRNCQNDLFQKRQKSFSIFFDVFTFVSKTSETGYLENFKLRTN